MRKKFDNPSRTSPKSNDRGCLCKDTLTYSKKCCDGTLWAQGIGRITATDVTPPDPDLLLNLYPNSAAAYSLRKLDKNYEGYAIEVRRASDNATQDIGFVNNELDTTTLSTFCSGTNGFVTTWYDQSGNGYDATQTTAANQPQIYDSVSGVITQGTKSSIDFGTTLQNLCLSVTNSTTNNLITVVHTANYVASKNQVILALSDNNYLIVAVADSGKLKYANSNDDMISTTDVGSFQLSTIDINDKKLYINGLEEDSVTTVSGASDRYVIANYTNTGANEMEGYISEIVIWQTSQTSNLSNINNNINAQYQIYWDGSQTSLLDTYSGSAAAYSLRALSSSYTGALIEVRRASDNATTDIYAKYDGTLNVDALESFCSGTDGFVTTWYDQSGNGYDSTQTTAASQPQIVSSGSVIEENGKPAIQFDNTDDEFTISVPNDFFGLNDITTAIVSKNASSSETGGLMQKRNAVLDGNFGIGVSNGKYQFQTRDTGTGDLILNTSSTYNTQQIITNYRNSSGIYFNSPEVLSSLGTKADLTSTGTFALGNGSSYGFFGVTIQETIIYLSDESSNLSGIETNINDFYSIY